MASGSEQFAKAVADWCTASKDRMRAVRNESISRLVDEILEPGPSVASTRAAVKVGAGLGKLGGRSKRTFGPVHSGGTGRLPIDTGYLRASFTARRGDVDLPLTDRPSDERTYTFDGSPVSAVLASTPLGQTITLGFTAKYAYPMEFRYAFTRLPLQRWPQIVANTAAEAMLRSARRA
jgi:hypothetical protein